MFERIFFFVLLFCISIGSAASQNTNSSFVTLTSGEIGIADISSGAAAANNTVEFGEADKTGGKIYRRFYIKNNIQRTLEIEIEITEADGSVSKEFLVNSLPHKILRPRSTNYFIIEFKPSEQGKRSATVTVTSKQDDKHAFKFHIAGTGISEALMQVRGGTYRKEPSEYWKIFNLFPHPIDPPKAADFLNRIIFANGTNFQNIAVKGYPWGFPDSTGKPTLGFDHTFIIDAIGSKDLHLLQSNPVSIQGPDYDVFEVVEFPPSTIKSTEQATFKIRFTPTASRDFGPAKVTINANADLKTQRSFYIKGTGYYAPEIIISAVGPVSAGGADAKPEIKNTINFGNAEVGKGVVKNRFQVKNVQIGSKTLHGWTTLKFDRKPTISGDDKGDFRVITAPIGALASGASKSFAIEFNPGKLGKRGPVKVSVGTNRFDVFPKTFSIEGVGIGVPKIVASGDVFNASSFASANTKSTFKLDYDQSVRIKVKSDTPGICVVSEFDQNRGTIKNLKPGMCKIIAERTVQSNEVDKGSKTYKRPIGEYKIVNKIRFAKVPPSSLKVGARVSLAISNDAGLDQSVLSLASDVCKIQEKEDNRFSLNFLSVGICKIQVKVVKTSESDAISRIEELTIPNTISFNSWNTDVLEVAQSFDVKITNLAGLPLDVASKSPSKCAVRDLSDHNYQITAKNPGQCIIQATAHGAEGIEKITEMKRLEIPFAVSFVDGLPKTAFVGRTLEISVESNASSKMVLHSENSDICSLKNNLVSFLLPGDCKLVAQVVAEGQKIVANDNHTILVSYEKFVKAPFNDNGCGIGNSVGTGTVDELVAVARRDGYIGFTFNLIEANGRGNARFFQADHYPSSADCQKRPLSGWVNVYLLESKMPKFLHKMKNPKYEKLNERMFKCDFRGEEYSSNSWSGVMNFDTFDEVVSTAESSWISYFRAARNEDVSDGRKLWDAQFYLSGNWRKCKGGVDHWNGGWTNYILHSETMESK